MMVPTSIISTVMQWTIFVLGVPGNLLIFGVYIRKRPWKSTDVLIMIQAMIDLIACVCPSPAAVGQVIASSALCWVLVILRQACSLATLFITFIIAVDRYLIICKQFRRSTKFRAILIASASIIFAIGISLLLPFHVEIVPMQHGRQGFYFLHNPLSWASRLSRTLQALAFLFVFLGCIYSYLRVYLVITRQERIRRDMDRSNQLGVLKPQPKSGKVPSVSGRVAWSDTRNGSIALAKSGSLAGSSKSDPAHYCDSGKSGKAKTGRARSGKAKTFKGTSILPANHLTVLEPQRSAARKTFMCSRDNEGSYGPSDGAGKCTREPLSRIVYGGKKIMNTPLPSHRTINVPGSKTTKMFLVVTIFCLITWFPYILLAMIPFVFTKLIDPKIHSLLVRARSLNHMINFFVFIAVNPIFRKNVVTIFHRTFNRIKCTQ